MRNLIADPPPSQWTAHRRSRIVHLNDAMFAANTQRALPAEAHPVGHQTLFPLRPKQYSAMSIFDEKFIVENKTVVPSMILIPRLAYSFMQLTCTTKIRSSLGEANAILHFAQSMLANNFMGSKKACEWTTAHETHVLKGERIDEENGVTIKGGNFLQDKPRLDEIMDMHNNALGLSFAENNKKIVLIKT